MGDFIKRWGFAASICFVIGLLLLDFSPGQKDTPTESPVESLTRDPFQTNVMDWEVTKLTPEQFQARYTELTGGRAPKEPMSQDQEHDRATPTEQQIPPHNMEIYEAEYAVSIELGEEMLAQAGVLVQVQEVSDGETIRKEFREVYENTGYLSSHDSSSSIKLVQNFVVSTLQDRSRLQISFNGYVERQESEVEWKAEQQRTKDPKHFSGSGFIQL